MYILCQFSDGKENFFFKKSSTNILWIFNKILKINNESLKLKKKKTQELPCLYSVICKMKTPYFLENTVNSIIYTDIT